MQTAGSFYSNH